MCICWYMHLRAEGTDATVPLLPPVQAPRPLSTVRLTRGVPPPSLTRMLSTAYSHVM